ncbi:MAG: helix-turn-helix domain-containing protein [Hahellaceae bacterium]|nr:helix-turn-helix domain-containing protein [Hahellaceae bacterium]MCP5170512.1 helix-turn-helix domain-containing protein [Hahellaceae bacterium]
MNDLKTLKYPPSYLEHIFGAWEKAGFNTQTLIKHSSLKNRLPLPENSYLTGQELYEIFIHSHAVYQNTYPFSLMLAQEFNFTSLGLLGLAVVSSKNLQEILQLVEKYVPVYFPGVALTHKINDDLIDIRFCVAEALQPLQPLLIETIVGIMKRFAHYFRQEPTPANIEFCHHAEFATHFYQTYFDCPVAFDCPENRLQLSVQHLANTPAMAEASTKAQLESRLEQMRSEWVTTQSWVSKVTEIWQDGLLQGRSLSLEKIAEQLNLTTRTLERRLQQEGTQFSQLIQELRTKKSLELLQHTRHTIAEIAYLVGFQDSNAFTRFFKQATQHTPSGYRKQMLTSI